MILRGGIAFVISSLLCLALSVLAVDEAKLKQFFSET